VPQISIIVEYEIHEGREEEFASRIKDHARRTLFEEEGCLRFEVLKPVDADGAPVPNRMLVSELYADQTAVDLHANSPRLAIMRAALGPLLKSRKLTIAQLVDDAADEEGLAPDELNASNDG
jgi:(4S)-4-hydroxy-5-phosphonooxypentane-2,3-dione isomerase